MISNGIDDCIAYKRRDSKKYLGILEGLTFIGEELTSVSLFLGIEPCANYKLLSYLGKKLEDLERGSLLLNPYERGDITDEVLSYQNRVASMRRELFRAV